MKTVLFGLFVPWGSPVLLFLFKPCGSPSTPLWDVCSIWPCSHVGLSDRKYRCACLCASEMLWIYCSLWRTFSLQGVIWNSLDTCRNDDACWFGEFLFVWVSWFVWHFLNSNIICIDLIVSGSCLVPGFVLFLKPFFPWWTNKCWLRLLWILGCTCWKVVWWWLLFG